MRKFFTVGLCSWFLFVAATVSAGTPKYFSINDAEGKSVSFSMGCNAFAFYGLDGKGVTINMPDGDASGDSRTTQGNAYVTGLGNLDFHDPSSPNFRGQRLTHLVWFNRPDPAKPEFPRVTFTVKRTHVRQFLAQNGDLLAATYANNRSVDIAMFED